jgi:lipopolysaccharide transport system ATP-binding protein
MDPIVRVEELSKKFKLYANPWHRAFEWASFGRKRHHEEFWALRNISFEVAQGECLGVIGPNGAGKSTLLKILTRALYPTDGKFEVRGRVLSLLELGTGFNLELTGRQNLDLSAAVLGFPSGYVQGHMEEIEDFSELGAFFDRPLKTYSSGMVVRLAFSMFVFLEPDVLIIDEALSVGDIFFQQKSFAKMREMISNGVTCLFVTHDMSALQNLCTRAALLDCGQMEFIGDAGEAVNRYFANLGSIYKNGNLEVKRPRLVSEPKSDIASVSDILSHDILHSGSRHGDGGLHVIAARVTDCAGHDTLQVEMCESLVFHLLLQTNCHVVSPSAGIHLYDRLGNLVFAAGVRHLGIKWPDLEPGDRIVLKIMLSLNVQPGEYTFSLGASERLPEHPANIWNLHDQHERLGPLLVTGATDDLLPFYGIARLPMSAEYILLDQHRATEQEARSASLIESGTFSVDRRFRPA